MTNDPYVYPGTDVLRANMTAHLRVFHRDLFARLDERAGELRTVVLAATPEPF